MKIVFAMSLLVTLSGCIAEAKDQKADGAENYSLMCAGCHDPGPGHPATMLLQQAGRPVPALIGRKDLELEYLRAVVRQGLIEMPPFRPTELSEAEIDEIYAHIMRGKPSKPATAIQTTKEP